MKVRIIILFIVAVLFLAACSVKYSFTGASIPKDVKTIAVKYFPNRASVVNPNLSQYFTEELIDRMKSQTSLTFVDNYADVTFEGEIVGYTVAPSAIQSDGAGMNRFSVTIKVKFTNVKDDQWDFETNFTHFEEFESDKNFAGEEEELVELIVEKLTEDIFNKAFSNW